MKSTTLPLHPPGFRPLVCFFFYVLYQFKTLLLHKIYYSQIILFTHKYPTKLSKLHVSLTTPKLTTAAGLEYQRSWNKLQITIRTVVIELEVQSMLKQNLLAQVRQTSSKRIESTFC